ncbi:MAG: ABC transporter substrate binding protein [Pyrinomonadaceae bacterium]
MFRLTPQSGALRGVRPSLVLILLLATPLLLSAATARAETPAKKVLVLSSYDLSLPGVVLFNQGMRSAMQEGGQAHVEFFYEIQEGMRIPTDKYDHELVGYLGRKYEGEHFDLIITLGAPALNFLTRHESELFNGTPKIYYFYDETEETVRRLWPNVTGVWAKADISKTLDMALALQPETRRVMVVSGKASQDTFMREQAQRELRKYEGKLEVTYLHDLTIDELKDNLAALPEKSVVLFVSFYTDSAGNTYSGPETISRVAPTSRAPIYGISPTYVGAGAVGGSSLDFEAAGKRMGEMIIRILSGQKPGDIIPQLVPNIAVFDWRELRRWGLTEQELPPGSIVRFREITFWERYKWYVAGLVAVGILEVALVVLLLVVQRRRRLAERERERYAGLAESGQRHLGEIVSNVPGIVWETMLEPGTDKRRTTFISDHVEKMLGYTPSEWVSQSPGFGLTIMPEEDRERVARDSETVIATRRDAVTQFRWRAKDGHLVWVETYLSPIVGENGKVTGLRGVSIDITEKKATEVARSQSEERNRAILQAVPDLMFLQTREGVYLDYHAANPNDLLVSSDVFLGKNLRDVLPPELAERFLASFRLVAETGEPQVVEYELDIGGMKRFYEARIVRSGENILSVVREITERKWAVEAIKESEANYRSIFNAASDAIFIYDIETGVILDVNQQMCEMYGVTREESRRLNATELSLNEPPYTQEAAMHLVQKAAAGEPQLFEWRARDTRGRLFWVEVNLKRVHLRGKDVLLAVVRDISERIGNEESLRESEKRFRATFEQAAVGMAHVALDGRWLMVNQKLCDIVGYSRAELLTKSFQEITYPEDLDTDLEQHRRLLAGEIETSSLEKRYVRKDGSLVWINLTISLMRSKTSTKPLYFINVIEDISPRKRAEEGERESEEKYRTLFNSMDEGFTVFDVLFDGEGRAVDLLFRVTNPAFERQTGWSNVVGRRIREFAPALEEVWFENYGRVATTGEPMRFIDWAAPLNKWYEVYTYRLGEAGSSTVAVLFSDVTERVRAVEALRRSEAVLTQAGQMASLGAWEADLSHSDNIIEVPVVWSDEVYRIFGYEPGAVEVSSGLFYHHVHPDDRQLVLEALRAALDEGRSYKLEYRIVRADGVERVVQAHADVEVDGAGRPSRMSGALQDITERKVADEALRRSEAGLAQASQMASLGAWEVDLSHSEDVEKNPLTWSDEVYRIYGYEPGAVEVSSELFFRHVHPDDRQRIRDEFSAARDERRPYQLEHRIVRADRAERVVQEHAVFDMDEAGRPSRIIGAVQDITERKAAEEALRQSEGRLRRAQLAARVGTWEWDARTGESVWSEMVWQLLGLEPNDGATTHERFLDFVHPEDRDSFLLKVSEVMAGGEEYYNEFRIVRRDGGVIWLSSSGRLIRLASGEPERFIGVNIDISERKLAQESLRQSETRFREMADTAPVMIWVADADQRSTYFNKQWLEFTGRSMDEELGNGWADSIHPDDYAHCRETFNSAFDRREPFNIEYRLRCADGGFRWVLDIGTPRFSSGGDFIGFIGSCIDIHARKESEDAMHTILEEVSRLKNQLQEENIYLREEIKLEHNFSEIVGRSDAIKYVLRKIEQVAPTDSTVLITGETGTGKELVARAIHSGSQRRNYPLVKVNCAALAASVIESELFGHEKGSFTGATGLKKGRFELANGATLFLDEIGELPLESQGKLLRVIQEGEFERLGGNKTIKVDVRIIAATNRNLLKEVQNGVFREDLWYRLNVFPITMPPLRQSEEDIPLLVEHFVSKFSKKMGKVITSVSPATLNALRNYKWPGNVRELANVIERAVINNGSSVLHITNIPELLDVEGQLTLNKTLEEMEREYIASVLDYAGWRIEGPQGAASVLGLHPSTLRTRMSKLGIQRQQSVI